MFEGHNKHEKDHENNVKPTSIHISVQKGLVKYTYQHVFTPLKNHIIVIVIKFGICLLLRT